MYEFDMLPSMMPSDPDKLPELTQQILKDLENCGTFAQCWDVRLDPSTNEVTEKNWLIWVWANPLRKNFVREWMKR